MAISIKRKANALQNTEQQVNFLYRRFYWNTVDPAKVGQEVTPLGTLPARAVPLQCVVRVNSTFDKDLIVGTSASGSSAAVVSSQDVAVGTTGTYVVDRYMGTVTTLDNALYVQLATSGATKGEADIWLMYLPVQPVVGSFNQGTSSAVIPTT